VGLALAADLGWRGIDCLLVEQTDGAIATPKMNEVNVRTMEICRRWGIADQVLNCPFPADHPLDVAFITNLFGYELARLPRPARNAQTPEPYSPYRLQACSQIWFDPILQNFARSCPTVSLRYHCRLDAFQQTANGVTATVTDLATGANETIEAEYLVGCDGANSMVRRALGIELIGDGTIGNPVHMFFRAPGLLAACGKNPATFFLPVDRDGMWGNLRIIDPENGLWRLMIDHTDGTLTPENIDREFYLRRALGRSFEVEWLEVSIWKRRSVVAEKYGVNRVFLAGDAVHQLSPTGALGMNTGIGDAIDLGWKLAAVLGGWGGAGLLATYERERRPIGARNVKMATGFYLNNEAFAHGQAALDEASEQGEHARRQLGETLVRDVGREFRTLGLQLGYRYDNSPICAADDTSAPADEPAMYEPTARPGGRAPHVWLRDGHSILDLFGRGFVLLHFPGAPDTATFATAAAEQGVPLTIIGIDAPDAVALYRNRLVLVRPDGHVAWRGDTTPTNAALLIEKVRGEILIAAP
jgi:2-polyprenyl-6-methoxyphenol hydroxylase-like FAD-dependent oxidoreductase